MLRCISTIPPSGDIISCCKLKVFVFKVASKKVSLGKVFYNVVSCFMLATCFHNHMVCLNPISVIYSRQNPPRQVIITFES